MNPFVLWNPINLIDGEARWFLTFLFIISVAAIATHFWKWLCTRLRQKFTSRDELIKDATVSAAISPVAFYIWFLTIIECIDLISDRFFSQSLAYQVRLLVSASAVLTIGWFLFRLKESVTAVLLTRSQNGDLSMHPGKVYGMAKLFSILIAITVALLLMEVTGVSVNTLIAFGGISGLALAFASQEIISNFFGGVMIHVVQPFALGDLINLPSSTLEGYVEEIGWYETRLRSKNMEAIYIPNSLFSKAYVINSTRRSHRRLDEKISIRHKDLTKAPKIIDSIRKSLTSNPAIDESQKLVVNIHQISPYSVDINIKAISSYLEEVRFLELRDSLLIQFFDIVHAAGAEIAVPVEAIISVEK
jgi:MscS family membrane protein